MEQIVFLNGVLLPRSQARISPYDLGFLYGYGLFETMRAYSGHIFRFEMHLERLRASGKLLGLDVNAPQVEKACRDTLKANKLDDARIRLTISIGEGEAIPDRPKQARPTVFVVASRYDRPPPETYQNGYKAIISSIRQNSRSPISRLKTINYLNNILARQEAKANGADEALMLNERDLLCEGSTSNLFIVSRGSLITPAEKSGCLPGITRQVVLEIAGGMGIDISQRKVRLDELLHADEAFLTNSLIELMPLTGVNGKIIGQGQNGKITTRLMSTYKKLIADETAQK